MEKIVERGEAVNVERLVNNLNRETLFLKYPDKVREVFIESTSNFANTLGPVKDELYSSKNMYRLMSEYADFLLKNDYPQKLGALFSWMIGGEERLIKSTTDRLVNSIKVANGMTKIWSAIYFVGVHESSDETIKLFHFKPETKLLYRSNHLTMGKFLELQPWQVTRFAI